MDYSLLELIRDLAIAGVGTFVGAWGAFRLESTRAATAKHQEQHMAGQKAIFILASQGTVLRNLRDQALSTFRDKAHREFLLQPMVADAPRLYLDLESLLFLLDSADPDVLNRVFNAERWYRLCLDAMTQRNSAHFRFQEALSHIPGGSALPPSEVAAKIPPHIAGPLRGLTNGLYDSIDEGLAELTKATTDLQLTLRAKFPEDKHIHLSPAAPAAAPNKRS